MVKIRLSGINDQEIPDDCSATILSANTNLANPSNGFIELIKFGKTEIIDRLVRLYRWQTAAIIPINL
jgi:hypothetical protein